MRLLFVSSTTGGGSGRSQRELARRLVNRGHEVSFLVDDKQPAPRLRWIYEQLSDLAARWGDRPGHSAIGLIEGLPGRRVEQHVIDGLDHRVTPVPENAFGAVAATWQPDVVVGNSLVRLSWRKIRGECDRRGIPTVLYVREVSTYGHVEVMDDPADALVANAASLADSVRSYGYSCAFVPSVIDTSITMVESDRSVALVINPIESHGVEMVWQIARQLPDVRFLVQESWPLSETQLAGIEGALAQLSNVEFRRRIHPGPQIYARARLLLVPHQLDNRPRVVAEAQANGIPVLVSDYPGLREAIGDGGITLGATDVDTWVRTITELWHDEPRYIALCNEAQRHGQRTEIQPDYVVDQFEEVLARAIAHCAEAQARSTQR